MARFLRPEMFSSATEDLSLLPFNFERTGANGYLVANMVGDFIRLTEDELNRLVDLRVRPGDGLYERAYAAHLLTGTNQRAQRQLLAARLRSRMSFLQQVTPLHIFVVTLRCEHSCPYCQVSRQSTDRSRFDMSEETAMRALDIAFSSPATRIKIEFQGGEPLLNFPLIRTIVAAAKARSGKKLDFVIASNLALLDDVVLDFCKSNDVLLSTSLDGPADLHNKNRPRPGSNSHELAVAGIRRAREILGVDKIGALMTTTEASLGRVDDIIDEYLQLGLDGIFLRPLSPFGFAIKTKQFDKYDAQKWLAFYDRGLRRFWRSIGRAPHSGSSMRRSSSHECSRTAPLVTLICAAQPEPALARWSTTMTVAFSRRTRAGCSRRLAMTHSGSVTSITTATIRSFCRTS